MEATMNSTKTHQEEVLFEFFKIEEHTTDAWPRAICIQCGALVRRFLGSTSAMKFHLSRKHRQLFKTTSVWCWTEKRNLSKNMIILKAVDVQYSITVQ
jgi:hypothetical protein